MNPKLSRILNWFKRRKPTLIHFCVLSTFRKINLILKSSQFYRAIEAFDDWPVFRSRVSCSHDSNVNWRKHDRDVICFDMSTQHYTNLSTIRSPNKCYHFLIKQLIQTEIHPKMKTSPCRLLLCIWMLSHWIMSKTDWPYKNFCVDIKLNIRPWCPLSKIVYHVCLSILKIERVACD